MIIYDTSYWTIGQLQVKFGRPEIVPNPAPPMKLLTEGDDTYVAAAGDPQHVYALGGDDTMRARDTVAVLFRGGSGNDTLFGAGHPPPPTQIYPGPEWGKLDTLKGQDGDDLLIGYGGGNYMEGAQGNDTLVGGSGEDALFGAILGSPAGDFPDFDVIDYRAAQLPIFAELFQQDANVIGGFQNDYAGTAYGDDIGRDWIYRVRILWLGAGADTVLGAAYSERFDGNNGADSIEGRGGADTLFGGVGHDSLLGGAGDDRIDGGIGQDHLDGGDGGDILTGGADSDRLLGGGAGDRLSGGQGYDSLYGGDGADSLDGSTEDDLLDGGEGMDTLLGGAGNDTLLGGLTGDLLDGGVGHDFMDGGAGADTIDGGSGNDTLTGQSGADSMAGGRGDDRYYVWDVSSGFYDAIRENPNEGFDTVVIEAHYNVITNAVEAYYTAGPNIEALEALGAGNFTLVGNVLDNRLTGSWDRDRLVAGDGADTLAGGAGSDTLYGEFGDDTYILTDVNRTDFSLAAWDTILEPVNGGLDTVLVAAAPHPTFAGAFVTSYTLGGLIENGGVLGAHEFTLVGNTLSNSLTGGDGADRLVAGDGEDTLSGGLGADTLFGEFGNDTYVLADVTATAFSLGVWDAVLEPLNGGFDTVIVSAAPYQSLASFATSYALAEHVEAGLVAGAQAFRLTGNTLDNTLVSLMADAVLAGVGGNDSLSGGSGADTLDGGADNDTLIGGNGSDSLDGGPGADSMLGGAGNDSYVVDDAGDRIAETRTGGADTVHAPITWTLGAHVEDLVLTGEAAIDATGNNLNNVITGNAAANTLLGGGRADTLIGGGGDDLYLIDATDLLIEQAGGGNDTVVANATFALPDHIEVLRFNGTANVRGDGNAENNFMLDNVGNNRLLGYDGNDTLNGGAGDDTLQGGEGADSLVGGEGVDRLDGGNGNDTYVLVDADVVIELANAGIDTVLSNISYTLPGAVEHLTLLGSADIAGTGNALDNVLIGNGGANLLRGLGGHDRLSGGQAGDTLEGGLGADTLTGSGGTDHFLWLSPIEGGDTLLDFRPAEDKLAFVAGGFGGLAVVTLSQNAAAGGVAQFVYTKASGVLEWDADGTGGIVAVTIATLSNKPTLAATDFVIV